MKLRPKDIIGIDMDFYETKIFKNNRKPSSNLWAIKPVPSGLVENNRIVSKELFGQHIRQILNERKISGKRCSLTLPSNHIITKVIILPMMDKQALIENIHYDMGEYLQMGIEHYIIDYKIVKTSLKDGRQRLHIMAIAVLKKTISIYIEILEKAGLKPLYIDVPSNSLEKFIMKVLPGTMENGNHCFVHIGAYSTSIFIFHGGNYFVDKTISYGYLSIISMNPEGAYVQQLIDEIAGVMRYFKNQIPLDNEISKLILLGSGAMVKNLWFYLEDRLNLETTLLADLLDFDLPFIRGIDKKEIMSLWNAIGSTIREENS